VKERVPARTPGRGPLPAKIKNRKINTIKTRFNSLAAGLCAAGLFAGMLGVEQADTIAFSPPDLVLVSTLYTEPLGNDGFYFTPATAISVTELGYVDCGFSVGHDVGLYEVSASTLLASATITGSSTLDSGFRYDSISPVLLIAGDEYAMVGNYPATGIDAGYQNNGSIGAAPEIIYDGYYYDYSSTLDLAAIPYATADFGPNFQYDVVPEPATTTMIIAGALLLLPFKAGVPRMLRRNRTP